MTGYIRAAATSLVDGQAVVASPLNIELNAIAAAFIATSGHKHDGSDNEGHNVPRIADADALNQVRIDTSNNKIVFGVEVAAALVDQLELVDGGLVPVTTADIDLGAIAAKFKNLYLSGTASVATLIATGNLTASTAPTVGDHLTNKTYVDGILGSATAASDSASAALTSENNAATSETNAAASAASIASGPAVSVNTKTGIIVLDPDDLDDTSTTNKFTTAAAITKLGTVATNADVSPTDLDAFTDLEYDAGSTSGGTTNLDFDNGRKQTLAVTGGVVTITLSNAPTSGTIGSIELRLVNGGLGTSIAFPVDLWAIKAGEKSAAFDDIGIALATAGENTVLMETVDAATTTFGWAA